ncbi:hypothetical protein RhiirC2_280480 [Rhizophagus irregularis]|uniref:Uncharacterized protein n=1 Tax=Rhizophagus irregularis TaxID=588596 RepID=A0A2N1P131_9GLOM|nr:hypothetical protein RhiirC2_280480 [Rhizophagus irregularis]
MGDFLRALFTLSIMMTLILLCIENKSLELQIIQIFLSLGWLFVGYNLCTGLRAFTILLIILTSILLYIEKNSLELQILQVITSLGCLLVVHFFVYMTRFLLSIWNNEKPKKPKKPKNA